MISKIRWAIAGTLMSVAGIFQLTALKVMPTDTKMLENILKQTRSGEAPDLPDAFDDR